MTYKVITPPTKELISVADVKEQLGIPHDDSSTDLVFIRRIKGARQWVESYCDRALLNQTIEFRFDSFSSDEIEVPVLDAVSVMSIKYIDGDGAEQTVDSADYVLDIYDHVIRLAYGSSWPSARSEKNACRVQYVAGYGTDTADVPGNIIDAVINIVGHWTNYQAQIEHGGFITQVPSAIRKILANYRTRFL